MPSFPAKSLDQRPAPLLPERKMCQRLFTAQPEQLTENDRFLYESQSHANVIFRRRLHQSTRHEACCAYGS